MSQSSDMSAGWPQQPPQPSGYPQAEWAGQEAAPTYIVDTGGSNVPTEFDHLFRGSDEQSRREIDRVTPAVGGALPGQVQYAGEAEQGYYQQQPAIDPQQAAVFQQQAAAAAAQFDAFQQPITYPQAYPDQQQTQYVGDGQYAAGTFGAATADQQYQVPQYQVPGADYNAGQYGEQQFQPSQGAEGGPRVDKKRMRLLLGGGAAVVVAVVLFVTLSNGGGSSNKGSSGPPAGATQSLSPKAELDQINALIAQSGQLRQDANNAVVDINACTNLSTAQTALQATSQQRAGQAASVAKISVTGVPNGAQLVQQLQAAWSASAAYDADYAKIAADLQGGTCSKAQIKADPNYSVANQQGDAADTAKADAASLWNTNAVPLGESKITASKL